MMLRLNVMQILNEHKTRIQIYSNSLRSQSIQTPKSAVFDTSLLFTYASFGDTKPQGLDSFTMQQLSQAL